jgi:hypothetical protein
MLYNIPTLPPINRADGELYGTPIPDQCKIPSELIEPYLQRFLMLCLEELAYFNTPVSEVKARLDGVRYFISCYAGIHANLATNNTYFKAMDMPDEELQKLAKNIFKERNP